MRARGPAGTRLGAWLGARLLPGPRLPLDALRDPGFVAIDLETTGLDRRRDAIVAMAAIPFRHGRPARGFVSLVDPARPIPAAATAIHGIDEAAVAGAPRLAEALVAFNAVCAGRIVAGHDVGFDLGVLARARAATGLPCEHAAALDTRRLVRALRPDIADTRLEVAAARLGLSTAGRHTADGDARMAGEILLALLPAFAARGAMTIADALRLQRASRLHD
jgi:DNA polymerase-3 subunit epsilon/CBS domain-containing protein